MCTNINANVLKVALQREEIVKANLCSDYSVATTTLISHFITIDQ